jgi:hypothetical protein
MAQIEAQRNLERRPVRRSLSVLASAKFGGPFQPVGK